MSQEPVTTPDPATPAAASTQVGQLRIDRGPRRRRRRPIVRWIVLALLLAGGGAAALGPLRESVLMPEVRAGVVTRLPATDGVVRTTASGYVVARKRASISSRLAGRLERLLVDVGDRVEEGQLLGQLGHDDLSAAVAEARAILAQRRHEVVSTQQRQRLAEVTIRSSKRKLDQAVSLVEAQKERVLEAERQLDLEKRLQEQGASSRDEQQRRRALANIEERLLDKANAEVLAAEVEVERTTTALEALDAELAAVESAVEAAQASLERTEALRADADILAPFSGVVLRKEAEVGEMVAPVNGASSSTRGAIVTLADFASLEIEVDVIERDIGRVAAGLPCRIVLDARRTNPYLGRVRQIVPTADRTRGTVQVKVAFAELDAHVLPEMSGRVEFLDADAGDRATEPDRVAVPAAALTARDGARGVLLVEEDVVRFQAVEVSGEPDGEGLVTVVSGVKGGEAVVLDPARDLVDGARVRVTDEAGP